MESRGVLTPERIVDGERKVDERPKEIEPQNCVNVCKMADGPIVHDREPVVVDERILHGPQIQARGECSQNETRKQVPRTEAAALGCTNFHGAGAGKDVSITVGTSRRETSWRGSLRQQ